MASKGPLPRTRGQRPGPWLWQEWPCGAAAGEGGRPVNRLEVTALVSRATVSEVSAVTAAAVAASAAPAVEALAVAFVAPG